MRQTIRFEPNQPVTVALEFPEGINVPGRYGPQIKFSLTNQRVLYADLELAQAIRILGVQPGEPFTITRRREPGKASWWDLTRVKMAAAAPEAPAIPSTPETPGPTPRTQPNPISAPGPALLPGDVKRIPPQTTPIPAPDMTPRHSGLHLSKTPPLKPSYEDAFRECLRIVREGLHDAGEAWSDHSVQAMTSTLFIQAAREGTMRFTVPRADKVA